MNSKTYWERREAETLNNRITDEKEYEKRLREIYTNMLDGVQSEINSFYGKYATKEGITIAEAKKRVKQADIAEYERKAKRYVKAAERDRQTSGKTDKNAFYFSEKANEEMRLYNLTMKVNRLEMLKANIGLEMIKGHAELETFMQDILQGRTEDELKRQAGILGETIKNNAKTANAIVNASFHNATFSDRIWQYHDLMKNDLSNLLQTGLIQGKNPRALAKDLKKYYFGDEKKDGGALFATERLMRTELARVQTEAQKQSFIKNGFEMYTFHTNTGCCDVCAALNGKHFKIKDMQIGENAAPIHPHCRCSCSAYEDSAEYERWLDFLANGGTTEQYNKQKVLEKSGNSSIIKVSKEKFTEYALNPSKAPDKAKAFDEALGYNQSNYNELMENIKAHIDESKFVEKGDSGHGMRYEYIMELTGANGKKANVLTAWIKEGKEKRLTSAYVTKKKVTE